MEILTSLSIEQVSSLALEAIGYAIYLLLSFILYHVVKYLRKKIDEQHEEVLRIIIEDGILFAQQVFGHLQGEERYEEALEYISEKLKEKNIKISSKDLKVMIESVLKQLKKEFGDSW